MIFEKEEISLLSLVFISKKKKKKRKERKNLFPNEKIWYRVIKNGEIRSNATTRSDRFFFFYSWERTGFLVCLLLNRGKWISRYNFSLSPAFSSDYDSLIIDFLNHSFLQLNIYPYLARLRRKIFLTSIFLKKKKINKQTNKRKERNIEIKT